MDNNPIWLSPSSKEQFSSSEEQEAIHSRAAFRQQSRPDGSSQWRMRSCCLSRNFNPFKRMFFSHVLISRWTLIIFPVFTAKVRASPSVCPWLSSEGSSSSSWSSPGNNLSDTASSHSSSDHNDSDAGLSLVLLVSVSVSRERVRPGAVLVIVSKLSLGYQSETTSFLLFRGRRTS